MGIYKCVRRSLGATFAVAIAVGMTLPTVASAKVPCEACSGSGSSLQAKQQEEWTKTPLKECEEPHKTPLKYTATDSGVALEEWGMQGGVGVEGSLHKTSSGNRTKLDAYIGTDVPPSKTEVEEGKTASDAWPIVVPTVQAPVAIIVHAPPATECEILGTEFHIPNVVLNKLWLSSYELWSNFLTAAGITFDKCGVAIKLVVRQDPSGTTFAFKNYLCQVEANSEEGEELKACTKWASSLGDSTKWPVGTEITPARVKGSDGLIEEVEAKGGSIGYVNLANASSGSKFQRYGEKEKQSKTKFWAKIQNNGVAETGEEYAEPGSAAAANCPMALTTHQETEVKAVSEVSPVVWARVHIAAPKTKEVGSYSICTAAYDVGWEKYTTTKLETEYEKDGTTVGNSVAQYFNYMVEAIPGGQYQKLPSQTNKPTILEKAKKIVTRIG